MTSSRALSQETRKEIVQWNREFGGRESNFPDDLSQDAACSVCHSCLRFRTFILWRHAILYTILCHDLLNNERSCISLFHWLYKSVQISYLSKHFILSVRSFHCEASVKDQYAFELTGCSWISYASVYQRSGAEPLRHTSRRPS